jgi:hypothetical protein
MRKSPVLGRLLLLAGLLLPSAALAEPVEISVNSSGPSEFTIVARIDADHLPVTYASVSGMKFTRILAGDPKVHRVPGRPDVPAIHRLVAIDPDKAYQLDVTLAGRVVFDDVLLMPEQQDMPDDGSKAPFAFDSDVYGIDRDLGAQTVTVSDTVQIGPVTALPLTFTPFHYNAAKRKLTVWRTVTARVRAVDGAGARFAEPGTTITPYQAAQVRALVENGKQVLKALPRVATPRVLVLTTTDLLPKARELAAGGRMPEVAFEFATVDGVRDAPSIRSLITTNYNRGGLDSVLIFGDEAKVPLYPWTAAMPGDAYYGLVQGTDNYLDVGLGRLPVSNEAEASIVIQKLARYDQLRRAGHLNKSVLLVAHKEDYPGKYTANQERVRAAANPLGLEFAALYGGAGATNADVIEAVNQGFGLVAYRGHGDDVSWWNWDTHAEGFGESKVRQLTNRDGDLTVFFDIACANGAIQKAPHSLAETLLYHKASDGAGLGAVAVLAATIDSFTEVNHNFNQYLFQAIQTEATIDLGSVVGIANNRLTRDGGGTMPANVKMYILFADPAMRPWLK